MAIHGQPPHSCSFDNIKFMSELILGWLNDELQLSRRVTSFERDFTNGFLFGEILARYNQQLNFNEFVDR